MSSIILYLNRNSHHYRKEYLCTLYLWIALLLRPAAPILTSHTQGKIVLRAFNYHNILTGISGTAEDADFEPLISQGCRPIQSTPQIEFEPRSEIKLGQQTFADCSTVVYLHRYLTLYRIPSAFHVCLRSHQHHQVHPLPLHYTSFTSGNIISHTTRLC